MSAIAPSAAAAISTESPNASSEAAPLQFSNDFLLKVDTWDNYSTATAIKKMITKENGGQELQGVVRLGKNPSKPHLFISFVSEEAKVQAWEGCLSKIMCRGKLWAKREVTASDLQVTHRKGGGKRSRGEVCGGAAEFGKQTSVAAGEEHSRSNNSSVIPVFAVCAWQGVAIEEQLRRKEEHCRKVLKVMSKNASVDKGRLRKAEVFTGVIRSPILEGYRNNVTLACGYGDGDDDGEIGEDNVDNAIGNETTKHTKTKRIPVIGNIGGSSLSNSGAVITPVTGVPTTASFVAVLAKRFVETIVKPLMAAYPPPYRFMHSAAAADALPPHAKPTSSGDLIEEGGGDWGAGPEPLLGMYSRKSHSGFWRKMNVRHNGEREVMLDIEICDTAVQRLQPQSSADSSSSSESELTSTKIMEVVRARLKEYLGAGTTIEADDDGELYTIVSLQLHVYNGSSVADPSVPREVLDGAACLNEVLLGKRFELSPTAFFQVNREAMNLLLERVASVGQCSPDKTILLDLCCGTGTIGICLAPRVKQVIGIEMVADAIENAKINAQRNGVDNATYICGKVEHALSDVLSNLNVTAAAGRIEKEEEEEEVVAILDPPRAGVHKTVIQWLRNSACVKRIIYISCEQRALEVDCEGLTKSATKAYRGYPSRVTAAFGCDLFPHTQHVEMAVVMDRVSPPPLSI